MYKQPVRGDKPYLIAQLNELSDIAYVAGSHRLGEDVSEIVSFLRQRRGMDVPDLRATVQALEADIHQPDATRHYVQKVWEEAKNKAVPDVSSPRRMRYVFATAEERRAVSDAWKTSLQDQPGVEAERPLLTEAIRLASAERVYTAVSIEKALEPMIASHRATPEAINALAQSLHRVAERLYSERREIHPN